jgi:5-hydroxyisourate hydrolase
MNKISTHVLDTVLGKPAAGVSVLLERRVSLQWIAVASSVTDADGRCGNLEPNASTGVYRLTFDTGAYLEKKGRTSIYPEIHILFDCNGEAHYHLPLLLSDNSYTTYRGS